MQFGIGSHLEETELEQYSMGILSEASLEAFEEHLLACDSCQDHLLEMEAYVNAMRSASPKLREARQLASCGGRGRHGQQHSPSASWYWRWFDYGS